MTDLATSGGKGDDLQKHFIDRIRTLEDAYSPAASRYFEWIEDTGRGFIDGLESYLKHLRETYQSARTISTYISAAKNRVRMLLPFLPATERGQLREYLRRLKPDKSERSIDDDKVLSGEEIEKLLAGLRSGKAKVPGAETIAVAAEFLQATGCRISELLNARWTDIVENGTVRLRIHGKGKKERTIPFVAGNLLDRIREHFRGDTFLFEHDGKQYTRQYLSQTIARAAHEILGRDGISAHTFRHSVLTQMVKKGIAVKAVSRFAGHSTTAVTQDMYVHVSVQDEDLVDLWGK